MATIIVKKNQMHELKEMINEGLHLFGRAMSVAQQMCEEGEMMGERGGYGDRYGDRMGMREGSEMGMRGYDPEMGMRDYPSYPMADPSMYGDRRGSRGRYSRY